MRRLLALALALVASTPAAGAPSAARPASDVPAGAIALVGGEAVPRATYDQFIYRLRRSYALHKRRFPPAGTPAYRAIKDNAVATLVWRVVLRQAAKAFGVEVPEALVEARLGQIREQWGGGRSFRRVLKRLGLTENLLRDEIRTRMLLEAVRDRILANVTITDAQIAEYYERNVAQFVIPQSREVRHIVVRNRGLAARLRATLRAGASFAALARRHSIDRSTRARGGVLDVYRGRGDPRFERVAFRLRTTELSRPVRTRAGWHVIQALSAVRPRYMPALSDVYDSIRDFLRLTFANALQAQWVKDAKTEWAGKTVYAPGFAPGE